MSAINAYRLSMGGGTIADIHVGYSRALNRVLRTSKFLSKLCYSQLYLFIIEVFTSKYATSNFYQLLLTTS